MYSNSGIICSYLVNLAGESVKLITKPFPEEVIQILLTRCCLGLACQVMIPSSNLPNCPGILVTKCCKYLVQLLHAQYPANSSPLFLPALYDLCSPEPTAFYSCKTSSVPDFGLHSFDSPLNGYRALSISCCGEAGTLYSIYRDHPLSLQLVAVWKPLGWVNPGHYFILGIVRFKYGADSNFGLIPSGPIFQEEKLWPEELEALEPWYYNAKQASLFMTAAAKSGPPACKLPSPVQRITGQAETGAAASGMAGTSPVLVELGLPHYQQDHRGRLSIILSNGQPLSVSDVATFLGWPQSAEYYRKKARCYIWAEKVSGYEWGILDTSAREYRKWRGLVWSFRNSTSVSDNLPAPDMNSSIPDEYYAALLSQNDLLLPNNSAIEAYLFSPA
ncbi:hypothetical protein FA15DRAFT_660748 [Coprinopsis marcescibilis]|uniref:Uncharacterized protein n=1 Tax=Coprinopsis marcescibilis TaxID=230819 RepID=A0A5C3KE29_COPMA|nr:hypothetical protein FA15DRAFT_660748 [Coprinopsis marcescibilis]